MVGIIVPILSILGGLGSWLLGRVNDHRVKADAEIRQIVERATRLEEQVSGLRERARDLEDRVLGPSVADAQRQLRRARSSR